MQRTLVIGDIHGCYPELIELCEKIQLNSNDRVIAVGDLVTKGAYNREVLDLFASDHRFTSVMGNHDFALVRRWRGEDVTLTAEQAKADNELGAVAVYRKFLFSLPFSIELKKHIVVHAGMRPGISLSQQSKDDLTELRTLGVDRTSRVGVPWYEHYDGEKLILFGHWPAETPRVAKRAIGLDTGCVYGNRLTGYVIETSELVSVPATKSR